MAMRRPRIKAQANIQLNAKRKAKNVETKPKIANTDTNAVTSESTPSQPKSASIDDTVEKKKQQEQTCAAPSENVVEDASEKKVISSISSNSNDTKAREENNLNDTTNNVQCDSSEVVQPGGVIGEESTNKLVAVNDRHNEPIGTPDAFKCPPKVGYQRSVSHTSNCGADDVFYSDIEENALQMDLQRSPNGYPMSPKNQSRQRIKATPIFGQRRNSFVGSSPLPYTIGGSDDIQLTSNTSNEFAEPTQRRERHLSASLSINSNSSSSSHHQHTPHKYLPNAVVQGGLGRMRTESGCSVFSDTNISTHKARKAEHHKFNLKREYEARFINGVPDKSCIKMSDLIYYNPATNPMEQKSNLNVKLENGEGNANSSSDMKPFKGKNEEDTIAMEESEAMPVPQLKLDSNGELILDDKSLVIETTAEQEARKVLANSSLIYLDEYTGMNGFYSRQKRTREWQSSETVKFYRCLQTVGTDFSLMVPLFPNRTRRDLKLKFKKEERINGNLINKALLYPKQFNIEDLKQQMEEEEKQREEEANRLKQLKEAAKPKTARKQRKYVRSSADCTLKGNVYQNEDEQKCKRPRNSCKTNQSETKVTQPDADTADDCFEKNNQCEMDSNTIKTETKRRRRRAPNIVQKEVAKVLDLEPPQSIKVEMIKNEPAVPTLSKTEAVDYQHNGAHEEREIDELPHSDMIDLINASDNCTTITQPIVPITESPMSSNSSKFLHGDGYFEESVIDGNESRTFVNLDDGSVTTVTDLNHSAEGHHVQQQKQQTLATQPTLSSSPTALQYMPQEHCQELSPPTSLSSTSHSTLYAEFMSNDTCSSMVSERELNERDIEHILTELAEGSLVLVSTLDPDDPDKVLNEIFMVDKNTGDLCDEPLNIPDNIIQCILSVMS